jgi:hypothetical protein
MFWKNRFSVYELFMPLSQRKQLKIHFVCTLYTYVLGLRAFHCFSSTTTAYSKSAHIFFLCKPFVKSNFW